MKNTNIGCFSELMEKCLLTEAGSFFNDFIKGHLMLEFLMLKCIEKALPNEYKKALKLTHHNLINLLFNFNIINKDMKNVLTEINKMRNNIAHEILYIPEYIEYKKILLLAQKASSDFTDGIIQSLEEMENKTNLDECEPLIYAELFLQLSYDLHEIYQEHGGDMEDFI